MRVWCLGCKAENAEDAQTCAACGMPMKKTVTGWPYVAMMILLVGVIVGLYFAHQYLTTPGNR